MTTRPIALAFFLCLLACGRVTPGSGGASQTETTAVCVDNQGFADMNVYAVRNSHRVRLGLVPGHSVKLFDVPRGLMAGLTSLRFIADPVGATRPSVSTVVMTIPPI